MDFSDIKAGDKVITTARHFGCSGYSKEKFNMVEWVELEVTKVTKVFYFIGDQRFRKCDPYRGFMGAGRHYLPGQGGAPEKNNTDEFEKKYALYLRLRSCPITVKRDVEKLDSLEDAADFSDRFISIYKELEDKLK